MCLFCTVQFKNLKLTLECFHWQIRMFLMILFCEESSWYFFIHFFSQISKAVMASKTDLRPYFKKIDSNNETSPSSQKAPRLFQSVSIIITREAEIQYVEQEVKKEVVKSTVKYSNVPSKIKEDIGRYALIHGTKSAIDRFSKVRTKYSLKRTTVNGWKESCKKKKKWSAYCANSKKTKTKFSGWWNVEKNHPWFTLSRHSNFLKDGDCDCYRSYQG